MAMVYILLLLLLLVAANRCQARFFDPDYSKEVSFPRAHPDYLKGLVFRSFSKRACDTAHTTCRRDRDCCSGVCHNVCQ